MVAMPLAHVSWALADNADRGACDAFFLDVFGAETAYEMLITPETEKLGFDREERLMMVGDTMLIPIAPAGAGAKPGSPLGDMLRRSAAPGRWIGLSLRVRLEIMQGELPNDPRLKPDWSPAKWRDAHPLGIEGLQSIGVSVPSLAAARETFAQRLDWPEIGSRALSQDDADCAAFRLGDTVIEAMQPRSDDSPLATHLSEVTGIYCLTFKVKDAAAAAAYLRGKGLTLIGDVADRFAIAPELAHGRLIWFTEQDVPGYPPLGTKMREPAAFPVVSEV